MGFCGSRPYRPFHFPFQTLFFFPNYNSRQSGVARLFLFPTLSTTYALCRPLTDLYFQATRQLPEKRARSRNVRVVDVVLPHRHRKDQRPVASCCSLALLRSTLTNCLFFVFASILNFEKYFFHFLLKKY